MKSQDPKNKWWVWKLNGRKVNVVESHNPPYKSIPLMMIITLMNYTLNIRKPLIKYILLPRIQFYLSPYFYRVSYNIPYTVGFSEIVKDILFIKSKLTNIRLFLLLFNMIKTELNPKNVVDPFSEL